MNKLVRYNLNECKIGIDMKNKKGIFEGCTTEQDSIFPELIETFENKEDGLRELKDYCTTIREECYHRLYYVTEYYLEEVFCYEDDEENYETGDILEFSKMEINVVNDYDEVVATFNNYRDADSYVYKLENNDNEDNESYFVRF